MYIVKPLGLYEKKRGFLKEMMNFIVSYSIVIGGLPISFETCMERKR